MAYPGVLKDFKDCIHLRSPKRVPVFALECGLCWKNSPMTYEEERTDIGKAVEVLSAVKITHPKPVTKADFVNVITQAYAGAPPEF